MTSQAELITVPPGLEGVAAAETAVGDVRGREGFYHYRQYSAVDLAAKRSFEDVWQLMLDGALPGKSTSEAFIADGVALRSLPLGLAKILPFVTSSGSPLEVLRTAISVMGPELKWSAILDTEPSDLREQSIALCATTPTILANIHRLQIGANPIEPRDDLSFTANYLFMMLGRELPVEQVRAIEQYLILMIDHGFNASTFTARVIASTGADLASAICGAIGSLSGPLHGGAPSRALAMLHEIGTPEHAETYVRAGIERGARMMGFGHRVYKTEDPRSAFLKKTAQSLNASRIDFAMQVEQTVVKVLADLKPGRELYANAEFYAGVVMDACGIPEEMFTPTFACARMVGWCAHIVEQAKNNRIIRPSARYVGVEPPVAVSAA